MTACRADRLNMSTYILIGDINRKGRSTMALSMNDSTAEEFVLFYSTGLIKLLGEAPHDPEKSAYIQSNNVGRSV